MEVKNALKSAEQILCYVRTSVMEVDTEAAQQIAAALIGVGLGEIRDYGYLRLDPALPSYLAADLTPAEIETHRTRWAAAMTQLVDFLLQQSFKDAKLAAQLTLLELPNLLALPDWLPGHADSSQIVATAGSIEQLLANLARPAALARAVKVREAAAAQIDEWSRAQFEHERLGIERLLAAGDLNRAYQAAADLQQRALAAGETAYPGADYGIAGAFWWLGRVLNMGGQAGAALQPLAEAQRRFQALADAGNASAARMTAVSIQEQGDCLTAVGQLENAAAKYNDSAKRKQEIGDSRGQAVSMVQLGTVRTNQKRYAEALVAYEDAQTIFEELGEPGAVATIWHQFGMVHRRARQFEAAERAYRQGLAIEVGQNNRLGQASGLGELGNLCDDWGRPEEAVTFYRQAADIYTALGDQRYEGVTRNNIADTLHKLGRNDEARREILRAIGCKENLGHAGTVWNAFNILQEIEQAAGNEAGAAAAWRQARDAYLAYRRDGGYAQSQTSKLCEQIPPAIEDGQASAVAKELMSAASGADAPAWQAAFAPKLGAILNGSRDPVLADDMELDPDDSAELLLLLERLGG